MADEPHAQEATSKSISAADAKSAEGFKKAMGTIKDELKKDADLQKNVRKAREERAAAKKAGKS